MYLKHNIPFSFSKGIFTSFTKLLKQLLVQNAIYLSLVNQPNSVSKSGVSQDNSGTTLIGESTKKFESLLNNQRIMVMKLFYSGLPLMKAQVSQMQRYRITIRKVR